jgi:hypothetical protein
MNLQASFKLIVTRGPTGALVGAVEVVAEARVDARVVAGAVAVGESSLKMLRADAVVGAVEVSGALRFSEPVLAHPVASEMDNKARTTR